MCGDNSAGCWRGGHVGPVTDLHLKVIEVGVAEGLLTNDGGPERSPCGGLFGVVISTRVATKAVAIVGRPVRPAPDDGFTLEVTRTRTDGCVAMEVVVYRAIWQLVRLCGYRRLITHTETGAIRRGLAGLSLVPVAAVPPRAASHVPRRLRVGRGVDGARRIRWEIVPGRPAKPALADVSIAPEIPFAGLPQQIQILVHG